VLEALGWGLLSQSSLLFAGLLVCWVTFPSKLVGIIGGFGLVKGREGRRSRLAQASEDAGMDVRWRIIEVRTRRLR
jgi:hypothetical protein